MRTDELMLIDISGLAHQIFHVSGNEPDPSFISTQLIARVRAIASQYPHAAICCDNGKSFRKDIDPTYKANRDMENRGVIKHQLENALETLRADGFPVWSVNGYEGDDIISTAVREALAIDPSVTVMMVSDDKDLTPLISERVTQRKFDGALRTPADIVAKFGVTPQQMIDYLCLVGDTSDNVKGANGIGGVKASALLKAHGSLQAVYDAMAKGVVNGITPALRTSLMEFRERWPLVKSLIELKSDAPIPFAEIAAERTVTDTPVYQDTDDAREQVESILGAYGAPATLHSAESPDTATAAPQIASPPRAETGPVGPEPGGNSGASQPRTELVRAEPLPPPVADFSLQLEPRTPEEAAKLAGHLFASRLFSAYGTWQGVLSTVLAGRELGIPALASLRAFNVIEGKPTMSASTIVALVLKSGKATYFRCIERTDTRATFETKRGDEPPTSLTFTIEEGRRAFSGDDSRWNKSGWAKNPADMCVARASSKLARLVYPDVVSGLYASEEMAD